MEIFYNDELISGQNIEIKFEEINKELKHKEKEIKILNNEIMELKNEQLILKQKLKYIDMDINEKVNYYKDKNFQMKPKDIIHVSFLSVDRNINQSFECEKHELFGNLIIRLLKEFPYLKGKKCYFICNGDTINEYETIEENKIKNGDNVIIAFDN